MWRIKNIKQKSSIFNKHLANGTNSAPKDDPPSQETMFREGQLRNVNQNSEDSARSAVLADLFWKLPIWEPTSVPKLINNQCKTNTEKE